MRAGKLFLLCKLMCILLCTVLSVSSLQAYEASASAGCRMASVRTKKSIKKKSASVRYAGNYFAVYGDSGEWELRNLSPLQRRFGKAVMKAIREETEDVVSIGFWNLSYDEEDAAADAIRDKWYLFTGFPVFYRADPVFHEISGPEEFFVDVRASRKKLAESDRYVRMCKKYVKVHVSSKAREDEKTASIIEGICRHMAYNVQTSSLRSVIRKGKGVCGDYAQIFKSLCLSFGIGCRLISGRVETEPGVWEDHVWNQVRVDGKWYYVDTTWLDACSGNGENIKNTPYYLSRKLWKDHRIVV